MYIIDEKFMPPELILAVEKVKEVQANLLSKEVKSIKGEPSRGEYLGYQFEMRSKFSNKLKSG